jgi:hypothetical protein
LEKTVIVVLQGIIMKKAFLIILAVFSLFFSCRTADEEKVKVESMSFDENARAAVYGEEVKVGVTVVPREARNAGTVEYTASNAGVVEISKDSSKDGVSGARTMKKQ